MAIADKITSIEEHLQADYESLENIGADLTNVDKNIENIASVVNGIYDTLPKTTGEGSSLSLNTIKGKMNIQVKGDTEQNGTPTPDTPIDIEVVTGTQEVKVENKNLFDKDVEQGAISSTINETYAQNKTSNNTRIRTKDIITLSKNKTYTISCNSNYRVVVQAFNENKLLYVATGTNSWVTSTTITNMPYIAVAVKKADETNITPSEIENAKVQIEEGSTATTYVEHQEQTQTISLGDIELCKIGNYQDYLYKSGDKWYKKEYIGKVVLNGSSGTISRTTTNRFNIDNAISNYLKGVDTSNYLSNMYIGYVQKSTNAQFDTLVADQNYGFDLSSGSSFTIRIKDTRYDTIADFQTFLNSNNLILYYLLETPNDIEITDTILISQLDNLEKMYSYNGTTNIEVVGDLPMIMKVSALKGE